MEHKKDNEITICEFTWRDIKNHYNAIVDMQVENTYKYHYPDKTVDKEYVAKKVSELEEHINKGNTYFLGAVSPNGELAGFIWSYVGSFLDEKRMTINSMFISENSRGKGIGERLMDEIKSISLLNGCDTIATHYATINQKAGSFYGKIGFSPRRVEMVLELNKG